MIGCFFLKTDNVEWLFYIQSHGKGTLLSLPKFMLQIIKKNKEKESVEIHDHLPPERRLYFKTK